MACVSVFVKHFFTSSGDFCQVVVVGLVMLSDSSTMPMHWNVFNEVVSFYRVCVSVRTYKRACK